MIHRSLLVSLTLIVLAGCSTLPRQAAVPEPETHKAFVPGLNDVRYIAGNARDIERMRLDVLDLLPKKQAYLKSQGMSLDNLPPANFLALSGGGDKGAYSAGLLNGWTAAGTRPTFDLVTGISTGALIAPYAFLGSAHDAELKEMYTNTSSKDLVEARGILALVSEDSVLDTTPLRAIIRKQITRAFLDEVAAEYQKGRILLIGTTNIDATKGVMWNMTKIASSQDPKALELFQNIMLASASIPVAFPPVMIEVEADGKTYQEMHVDGGTMAQVFIYPSSIKLNEMSKANGFVRKRNLYIIMNERIDTEWAETQRSLFNIGGRAVGALIHNQGIGDLYRLYVTAQQDGLDFNLAYIPADFNHPDAGVFNSAYMKALYQRGYDQAIKGYDWMKAPPGLVQSSK
ncbi:MAG: patatin [Gammaproteobacteria bacterium 28-57-27]|nr:MAG: patatin [Gammaproteobacteria bacterium 28-57-27]